LLSFEAQELQTPAYRFSSTTSLPCGQIATFSQLSVEIGIHLSRFAGFLAVFFGICGYGIGSGNREMGFGCACIEAHRSRLYAKASRL
jgi:hypothetical protein